MKTMRRFDKRVLHIAIAYVVIVSFVAASWLADGMVITRLGLWILSVALFTNVVAVVREEDQPLYLKHLAGLFAIIAVWGAVADFQPIIVISSIVLSLYALWKAREYNQVVES